MISLQSKGLTVHSSTTDDSQDMENATGLVQVIDALDTQEDCANGDARVGVRKWRFGGHGFRRGGGVQHPRCHPGKGRAEGRQGKADLGFMKSKATEGWQAWQPTPVFLPGESRRQKRAWRATAHRIARG